MSGLSYVRTTVFGFHVHVDSPDVHALGVVCHDALEHRPALLGITTLELKHTEFRNQIYMLIL